ncbi:hypothetical protein BH10CHL1_BH10CHL1_31860 [soil metagenome]
MSSKVSRLDNNRPPTEPKATMLPNWDAQVAGTWRENPERMAWTILLASFIVFMVLAISIPLAISYAIRYTTVSEKAQIQPALGTLLLYQSATSEALAVTGPRDVVEGNMISATIGSTQGTLKLISAEGEGEALGSIDIYADTNLEVLHIRRPLFKRSREPYQVDLRLNKGEASIFTNTGDQRPLQVELETPHGIISLKAGNYRVSVDATQTNITVRSGEAILMHDTDKISVDTGLRAWMTKEQLKQAPKADQSLIRNGNFTALSTGNTLAASDAWTSTVVADNVAQGSVSFVAREGRTVAYFRRDGEDSAHTEVSIKQKIDKNVNLYNELILQLDVNILFQSLPGGGDVNTEFPVRIEINYTDIYGKDLSWGHGFYYRLLDGTPPRLVDCERVDCSKFPQAQWQHYESPNLIETWKAKGTPAARINSIRIYASGHNYRSMVSDIDLVAK